MVTNKHGSVNFTIIHKYNSHRPGGASLQKDLLEILKVPKRFKVRKSENLYRKNKVKHHRVQLELILHLTAICSKQQIVNWETIIKPLLTKWGSSRSLALLAPNSTKTISRIVS